ncbi:cell wall anchor protein [Chryseobacterium gleum]|uniref:cell wall anchor protein n=1 Tax=Chryseobacterium gleum TaxID=250 RepID=UPI001E2FF4A0|nr:cell wall anchor protein [Chryseobacterium gleum]MCE4065384.1 cell wall anchor protein [Chryseobacterium gleum]
MKKQLFSIALLVSSFTFAQSWNITGNSGTNSSNNFIGTTDNQPLILKSNNLESIRIKPNGNIGVGTVNPDTKLHVAQDNTNNQNLILGKFTSFGQTGGSAIVSLAYNSTTANLEVNSTYAGNGFRYGTYGDFNIENDTPFPNFGAINFITNNKVQLAIMPNGNASLQGKLEAKELKVTLTPTADFVFDEKYNLPKLEEVEKHIKEKKHLPEIASAKVMEKEGVNVGEFQIKLLQKIEELTLYSIEQNKQIKQQSEQLKHFKDENEALKAQAAKIEKLEQQFQQLLSTKK